MQYPLGTVDCQSKAAVTLFTARAAERIQALHYRGQRVSFA